MNVIRERDAAAGIAWAQGLLNQGKAEEYALGATTLEDVYIRMTGRLHDGDRGAEVSVASTPGVLDVAPRRGPGYWFRGYAAMVRWHLFSLRLWAMTAVAVEVLAGVGMVLEIGLLVSHISSRAALYGTTGSAVVAMLLVGLTLGPQLIAQQKMNGTYEYLLTLPAPRRRSSLGLVHGHARGRLPAAAATLFVGTLRYDISLTISPRLAIAVLLGVFTATMLGYALAHAISKPMLTILISELFIFLAFGYAPINFPPDQMPQWLVDINRGLPFLPIATTVRDGLTHGLASNILASYLVLAAWAIGSVSLALLALGRRR